MITAISFSQQFNRKYEKQQDGPKVYGRRSFADMQQDVNQQLQFLQRVQTLVQYIEENRATATAAEAFKIAFGIEPPATIYSKKRRAYSWSGITVHEEDQQP